MNERCLAMTDLLGSVDGRMLGGRALSSRIRAKRRGCDRAHTSWARPPDQRAYVQTAAQTAASPAHAREPRRAQRSTRMRSGSGQSGRRRRGDDQVVAGIGVVVAAVGADAVQAELLVARLVGEVTAAAGILG